MLPCKNYNKQYIVFHMFLWNLGNQYNVGTYSWFSLVLTPKHISFSSFTSMACVLQVMEYFILNGLAYSFSQNMFEDTHKRVILSRA